MALRINAARTAETPPPLLENPAGPIRLIARRIMDVFLLNLPHFPELSLNL